MCFRIELEDREYDTLSPYAAKARESRGRMHGEEPCSYRTCFQRDRDRILHCKSFRRLMHKTQVFLSPEGDHFTTRLTHSLEVSQIARTIARALRLNEDLTEAIALGHDLGHTPFGHAGERALNEVVPGGYRHYDQSVRVVEKLEKDGQGLNLSWEVVDGIRCHTNETAATLEGQVVRFADRIAYMNHDMEDAIRAGILKEGDLPIDVLADLGRTKSQRITALIDSLVQNSDETIKFDPLISGRFEEFHQFMFSTVYVDPLAKGEESKAVALVQALYDYYLKHPAKLPAEFHQIWREDGAEQAVCDYISGMSDRFATATYTELFVPKSWQNNLYD